VGISFFALMLAYAELGGKFIPFPDYKSPFRDIYGYPEIAAKADELLKQNPSSRPGAIAVTNWTMGSRVMYYSLPYGHEVFVMDERRDQFDIWQKKSPLGYDLLFLNTEFEQIDVAGVLKCDQVDRADRLDLTLNGSKVNRAEFVWCRNYQGVKP
jgi:hypothetical protein